MEYHKRFPAVKDRSLMFFSLKKDARTKGREGEEMALRYFRKNRFQLLERNWKTRKGEVDLILEKDKTLYFVEVKFRKNALFGRGEESIHLAKQRKIVMAALEFLQRKKICEQEVRFGGLIIDGSVTPYSVQWFEFPLDLPPQYY